jgi:2-polyprenyl-3-methyl-5-hydroxy-6-metoxy-1,4-benzoquinol methylase
VARIKEEAGEVHALDMGCGAGLLAALAARAGAASVVAADLHEPLCAAARKACPLLWLQHLIFCLAVAKSHCCALHL